MKKDTNNEPFKFTSTDLIVFAWDKRLPLFIICLAAAILSTIMSFRITEMFQSSVVLFPAPATSVSKALLSDQYAGQQALLEFGQEEETEQLLQILNSDFIRNRIIAKYNLMEHYEIDHEQKYARTILFKKYSKNITFKRTKYESIVIEVLDKVPQTAADIANDIAILIDSTMNNIQRERAGLALKTVEREYFDIQRQIQEQEDSLNALRNLGIFEYESQSEVLSDAYANAILEDNQAAAKSIKQQLDLLAKYGGAYVSIRDKLEYDKEIASNLKEKYTQAKVDAEQILPHKYIVNSAVPADRKSYPKKSMVVLQSTLATFLFAYIILLIATIIKRKKAEN